MEWKNKTVNLVESASGPNLKCRLGVHILQWFRVPSSASFQLHELFHEMIYDQDTSLLPILQRPLSFLFQLHASLNTFSCPLGMLA